MASLVPAVAVFMLFGLTVCMGCGATPLAPRIRFLPADEFAARDDFTDATALRTASVAALT